MLREPFADAEFLVLDHRQVARVRRRRRHGLIPQRVQHPGRAADRKGPGPVRKIGQDARHAQHAAAPAIGGGRHSAELLPLDALDAVVLREAFVDDQEIAVEEIRHRQVLAQDLGEELQRFAIRAVSQGVVIAPIEVTIGRVRALTCCKNRRQTVPNRATAMRSPPIVCTLHL